MKRPDFIKEDDIIRWSNILDNDSNTPELLKNNSTIREICYAGLYLSDELSKLLCPEEIIFRLQDAGGRLSFGRDTWEVHQEILNKYINNQLIFEDDEESTIN